MIKRYSGLQRAIKKAGGVDQLAKLLGTNVKNLQAWLREDGVSSQPPGIDNIISRAVKKGGGATAVARTMGVSYQAINLWIKQRRHEDGDLREGEEEGKAPPRVINLSGKNTTPMGRGDRIVIQTPGGGGWGSKPSSYTKTQKVDSEMEETKEHQGAENEARNKAPINERNASGRMAPLLNDPSTPSGVMAKSGDNVDPRSTHGVIRKEAHHATRTKGSIAEWSSLQLGA